MNKVGRIILGIVLVAAMAGGAFYGGTVYGKSQLQAQFTAGLPRAFQNGRPGAQGGPANTSQGSMLIGEIKTVNEDGLVVTDSNNNEIIVKVASTTLIEKNMSVKVTDLAEGETVMISGNKADDGTITARSLQVAPAGRFGAEGGAAPIPQGGQGRGTFGAGGQPGGAPPGQ